MPPLSGVTADIIQSAFTAGRIYLSEQFPTELRGREKGRYPGLQT